MVLRRGPIGAWCGYVYVGDIDPPKDGWDNTVDVHGGITWDDEDTRFLAGGHWIGFDCAHAGDYVPGLHMRGYGEDPPKHWTETDAWVELVRLANQVDAYARRNG